MFETIQAAALAAATWGTLGMVALVIVSVPAVIIAALLSWLGRPP